MGILVRADKQFLLDKYQTILNAGGSLIPRKVGTTIIAETYSDINLRNTNSVPIKLNDKGEVRIYAKESLDIEIYDSKGALFNTERLDFVSDSGGGPAPSSSGVSIQNPTSLKAHVPAELLSPYLGGSVFISLVDTDKDVHSGDYRSLVNSAIPTIATIAESTAGDLEIDFPFTSYNDFLYLQKENGDRLSVNTDYTYIVDTDKIKFSFEKANFSKDEKIYILALKNQNIDFFGDIKIIEAAPDKLSFITPSNFNQNRRGIIEIGNNELSVKSKREVKALKKYDLTEMLKSNPSGEPSDITTINEDFDIKFIDSIYEMECIRAVEASVTPSTYRGYFWGSVAKDKQIKAFYSFASSPTETKIETLLFAEVIKKIPAGAYIEFKLEDMKGIDFLDFLKLELKDKDNNLLNIAEYIQQPDAYREGFLNFVLDTADSKYKAVLNYNLHKKFRINFEGDSVAGVSQKMLQYLYGAEQKLHSKIIEVASDLAEIGKVPTDFKKLVILDSTGGSPANSSFQNEDYVIVLKYERLLLLEGTGLDLKTTQNNFSGINRPLLDHYITQSYGNSVKKASNERYRIEFNIASTINYVKAGSGGGVSQWNNFAKDGIFTMKDKLPLWETTPNISNLQSGAMAPTSYKVYIKQTPQGIAPYYAQFVKRAVEDLASIGIPTTYNGASIFNIDSPTECNMILYDVTILND